MQQRNTDNVMPNSRSRRRLVLTWLRRERARRFWVSVMIAAARRLKPLLGRYLR
jgi:hypothetical protein